MGRDPGSVQAAIPITSTTGLVDARQRGRSMAAQIGFSPSESTLIAAAISELARNIVQYAEEGEILLRIDGADTLLVVARDNGPGIADTELALRPGYSTSGGLGLGLAGVRRIADHFEIASNSHGTTVTFAKRKG